MTSQMPVDDSLLNLEPNALQDFDNNHQTTNQQQVNVPADDMREPVLDEDQTGRDIASHHITQPAAEIPTQDEQFKVQPQPSSMQEVITTSQQPGGPPLLNDHPATLETDDSVGAPHPPADTESGTNVTPKTRSKLTMASMVVLSAVVVSVIVVPGVILGVLLREARVGIALCGAIATVVGVFAGFYYYQNKEGDK